MIRQYIASIIDLNEGEKELISSVFKSAYYQEGEYILQGGRICKEIGFLTRGVVAYFFEEDEPHVYRFSKEHEFVCNYESFLTATPSTKSIKCIEPVEMLCVDQSSSKKLCAQVNGGEKLGRLISEQLFLEVSANLTSFYTDNSKQRYRKFLKQHSDLNQRVPQYLIAPYVKVKPQSLSRIRKRMLAYYFVNPGS